MEATVLMKLVSAVKVQEPTVFATNMAISPSLHMDYHISLDSTSGRIYERRRLRCRLRVLYANTVRVLFFLHREIPLEWLSGNRLCSDPACASKNSMGQVMGFVTRCDKLDGSSGGCLSLNGSSIRSSSSYFGMKP